MPAPTANSPFSQPPLTSNTQRTFLAQLFLAVGFGAVGLLFGLFVWRLMHLPLSSQSAAKYQEAPVRSAATPRQEIGVEKSAGPGEMVRTGDTSLLSSSEERQQRDPVQEAIVIDAPPRLSETRTSDEVMEQRLRASEDDLRSELGDVPEVRFLSDLEVKKVRKDELAAQMPTEKGRPIDPEAARAELNAAQEKLRAAEAYLISAQDNLRVGRMTVGAYYEASRAYKEAADLYTEVTRRCTPKYVPRSRQVQEQIGYNFSLRLHQTLTRAATQAGLPLQSGPHCQLDLATATDMAKLSRDLRIEGFVTIPGLPPGERFGVVVDNKGRRIRGLIADGPSSGVPINGQSAQASKQKVEDKIKAFQSWCDRHTLEIRSGTVPTLTQLLQIEDEPTRLLLVRELIRSKSEDATTQLAVRAIVDLSPAVRQAALDGLLQRPSSLYLPVLLRGLRYPWPPVADHSAVALRTLQSQEAVASLIELLDLPSPSAPVFDAKTKQYTVREMVRLNHLRNCLLCHAPSANKNDGLARGLVPTPGEPLPLTYYESPFGDFVRADITFLRQDFSANLPVEDAEPWPNEQRFDFVTRLRTVSAGEVTDLLASSANYPQRDSVLYALRGLTGEDGGDSSALWRQLLGLSAGKPKGEKKSSALEKLTVSTPDTERAR